MQVLTLLTCNVTRQMAGEQKIGLDWPKLLYDVLRTSPGELLSAVTKSGAKGQTSLHIGINVNGMIE
jgi:hypothetical protein